MDALLNLQICTCADNKIDFNQNENLKSLKNTSNKK